MIGVGHGIPSNPRKRAHTGFWAQDGSVIVIEEGSRRVHALHSATAAAAAMTSLIEVYVCVYVCVCVHDCLSFVCDCK